MNGDCLGHHDSYQGTNYCSAVAIKIPTRGLFSIFKQDSDKQLETLSSEAPPPPTKLSHDNRPGLPDGIFTENSCLSVFLRALEWKMLVCFMVVWLILKHLSKCNSHLAYFVVN
jgi:hypothetical protein